MLIRLHYFASVDRKTATMRRIRYCLAYDLCMLLTPHQAKYIAHDLTLQHAGGGVDRLSQALFNASVDLNPHQIEAAVFATLALIQRRHVG